jgi:hypothetical protein
MVVYRQAASAKGDGEVVPVVTEYLFQLVAKQVEDRGLVVWYDPEKAYVQAAAELTLPTTTVARYSDSFFSRPVSSSMCLWRRGRRMAL